MELFKERGEGFHSNLGMPREDRNIPSDKLTHNIETGHQAAKVAMERIWHGIGILEKQWTI